MDKDFAISVRDQLNDMAREVVEQKGDIEGEVCSCCIAIAVEELEKWIYGDNWTPSVTPAILNKKWFKMPKDKRDDELWEGPPWDRQPKSKPSVEDKFPTLTKVKKERERRKRLGQKMASREIDLSNRKIEDWTSYEKHVLESGTRSELIRAVVSQTRSSVKAATEYIDRLIDEGKLEEV